MGETNIGALTTGLVKITVAAGGVQASTGSPGTDYISPTGLETRLGGAGAPASSELGYVKGVTSAIQAQINALGGGGSSLLLTTAPGEHASSGLTVLMTAGASLARGNVCYIGADGKLELCDADAAATMPAFCMVIDATIAENAVGNVLLYGIYQDASWAWATVGALLYPGTTPGTIVDVAPAGVGDQVQPIGWVLSATKIFFLPYPLLVEVGVESVDLSTAQTLTNKRITKRSGSTTSSATPTINTDNIDFYHLTAQAVDITSFTTNLTGTPVEGDTLHIAITGTAARAIVWGASFEASTVALPTTTVTTARLDVEFIWNTVTSKWRVVAVV